MSEQTIRFDDGAAYERMMGRWSRLVGERFLDWIAVPDGARWLDVGCGNGAFTELIVERCRPAQVLAFDPSPGQLDYARGRLAPDAPVLWGEGDAMRLPVADASADAAVMALVLFFVPEPAVGVAEMCRAVRAGGVVAAYHWDILEGGFPLAAIGAEMLKQGLPPRQPPSVQASTLEASAALWRAAGLERVQTCQFSVQRRFDDFDEYWNSAAASNTLRPMFESMDAAGLAQLQARVRERLRAGDGPLTVSARANAVRGVKVQAVR
ncbi:class I SAM-dependent methyltransferase [Roseateles violae]|uniref:Methyltransferase domain-containing protein n=1 Tax=Roseateles violae TaxID=3058042 RepID=A0ABT8DJZ7_9BURK|nr:methyltransferase domain-containing protein [Pelomonas sp. PFR6]MDN3918702.1 methyltransferase domain-containing protein [Pelomonas sp. PFR6]